MDQLVQCPVCTLFLHNGMSLESHLDTHPKDQVIKALCSLTSKGSSCGSRTSTPLNSERSYRSRSRTPATEDSSRWTSSHRSTEHERYWRRTPSRTPKTNPMSSLSRNSTPDIRLGELNFETGSTSNSTVPHGTPFITKVDKTQQTYQTSTLSEYDQHYVYFPESQEDREIKYSRSAEYAALDNTNNLFTYNMPTMGAGVKLLPAVPRRSNDIVKLVPKQNNILLKTNLSGMQYIGTGVKPMHVVVPTAPTFVQKTQNNMIVTGKLPPNVQMQVDTKVAPSLSTNQLHHMHSNAFTPNTTVVTTNSQIIYQEMVHNIDGKPFITSMPTVLGGHENVANVAQASTMYQNVMVVDPFGNASCMYPPPPPIVPKVCPTSVYNDAGPLLTGMHIDKPVPNLNDMKRLIIDEGSMQPPPYINPNIECDITAPGIPQPGISAAIDKVNKPKADNIETKNEIQGSTSKGLKILSNIKVEVPVQHHKNMVNTIMDLTGSNENDYSICSVSPEKILPDLQDNNGPHTKILNISVINSGDHATEPERILPDLEDNIQILSDENTQPSMSSADSMVSNTFSVIKNVGNPPSYKDFAKTIVDNKIEAEFSDSCPVPDLICNEKPSISPCSELSEMGDNSTDHTSILPNAGSSQASHKVIDLPEKKLESLPKPRQHALRLNNIYVKKNKKILQIKNSKASPVKDSGRKEIEPAPSSSTCKSPENFVISKMHQNTNNSPNSKPNSRVLLTISVEKVNEGDSDVFDADTEEQSMDIEPMASSTLHNSHELSGETIHVKEEVNSSNEGLFSNETGASARDIIPMETLRPINVITYGSMSTGDFNDESNDRELLDLEATTKNRQFVSMMNENYFGDNIYADYFTPDRVESFDSAREPSIWGEPSQKENEFVLPNFIHESYKIAESNGIDYSDMGCREKKVEALDVCERDSKMDLLSERSDSEAPLNICANERMPSRGELSGQESNGDMESPWSTMYAEGAPSGPYDLIARESWVSDGSEMDANEKRDTLEEELQFAKSRLVSCALCGMKWASAKELRAHRALVHRALAHSPPHCAVPKTSYSRLITARTIKKEKHEKITLTNNLLTLDSKESITSTILQVYENMEAKPKLEALIKQEPKRKKRDYVCPTCKVDQLSDAGFHEHLKIHPLECLTCGKCFLRRSNLALHVKTHLGIKNYKCEVCEKRFITRQKLMEHHNVHTGRTPVKCTVCPDTFRRFSNMVQHRDRHHRHKRAKIRDYVCQCGAVFHSRAKLLWHKETHDDKPKACLHCSEKFVHAASLTRHVRRSHNEFLLADKLKGNNDNVSCPVCKQVFLRSNLRKHLQTHSGQRPYHCIICNKYFTTKWNLKLHRWTHMSRSAKPYKCGLCKSAFMRQPEFISHMNAHKAIKPYTCNYCGCKFIRKYNCQRHVREHELAKKYVCKVPECGKSFHRNYYLLEHMKVHSGARPFSCNICGKTSSNKSNHNKHVKIHHAREPVATEA